MRQRTRVRRVCERAAVASIAAFTLLGAACLNELEPSIAQNLCRGNLPDGVLDPGEECDTRSFSPGDGCSPSCRVECPPPPAGFKDPRTAHCYYFPPRPSLSHIQADNECVRSGGSLLTRLATLRSEREAAFVRDALAAASPGGATPVRTAYVFGRSSFQFPYPLLPGTPPVDATLDFRQAAPPSFQAEPGLLAYYTVTVPFVFDGRPAGEALCSGCYGAVEAGAGAAAGGEQWWGPVDDQAIPNPEGVPAKALSFDPSTGLFSALELSRPDAAGSLATLCERVPDSMPRNECAGGEAACPDGPSLRFRLGASTYAYFDEALGAAAAAARCSAIGAHLWIIDDEDERERVVRLLAANSAPISPTWPIPSRWSAWVGVSKQAGAWTWADGAPADAARPVPWALEPNADWGVGCGYVMLRGSGFNRVEAAPSEVFAVGLVIPSSCSPSTPPADPSHPGLLCEQEGAP
ncbi:MAG: hypothetical protein MUF34_05650 [Polyangiaceae bacterium]|nr:hypothetical protein [Polyangiaceae bacterium]